MRILDDINSQLLVAEAQLNKCKEDFLSKKKELVEIETILVEAKINYYKILDDLNQFKASQDFSGFEDPRRDQQIQSIKDSLPHLIKLI